MIIPNIIIETKKELELIMSKMGDEIVYFDEKECDRLSYQCSIMHVTGWHVVGRTKGGVSILYICVLQDEDEEGNRYGNTYYTLMKGEWL